MTNEVNKIKTVAKTNSTPTKKPIKPTVANPALNETLKRLQAQRAKMTNISTNNNNSSNNSQNTPSNTSSARIASITSTSARSVNAPDADIPREVPSGEIPSGKISSGAPAQTNATTPVITQSTTISDIQNNDDVLGGLENIDGGFVILDKSGLDANQTYNLANKLLPPQKAMDFQEGTYRSFDGKVGRKYRGKEQRQAQISQLDGLIVLKKERKRLIDLLYKVQAKPFQDVRNKEKLIKLLTLKMKLINEQAKNALLKTKHIYEGALSGLEHAAGKPSVHTEAAESVRGALNDSDKTIGAIREEIKNSSSPNLESMLADIGSGADKPVHAWDRPKF